MMMATTENYKSLVRTERFTRLVAAYHAACRWELWNSRRLFENKLLMLGAWMDDEGQWRLDELPKRQQPY